jgi:hypothetical protein
MLKRIAAALNGVVMVLALLTWVFALVFACVVLAKLTVWVALQ